MKILVTGATGHLGNAVIGQLLKHIEPNQISVITRKEGSRKELEGKGFNAFVSDYDSPDKLKKAMKGVDTVLLISAGDQGDRMQQHKNVIDSSKKAGVENIAYTSRALRDRNTLTNDLMMEHFLTEDLIIKCGLNYTIFRNALYMDVLPLFLGERGVFETGIIMPAGDGEVAYCLRAEQGEAIANVLVTERFKNKIYKFTGSDSFSFHDVAKALTELSGKDVKYTPISEEKFTEIKSKFIEAPMLKKIIDFNTDIANGQESEVTLDLEKKLGRKPTGLKEGIKQLFNL